MDSWPASERNDLATTTLRKVKQRPKEKAVFPNYPDVVPGSLNAVTLTERGSGFEWISIMNNLSANKGTRPHMNNSQMLFPPTRPPTLPIPRTTIRQRAEQGANFLRTFLPDVDIPAELIRDEIALDAKLLYDTSHFDPYIGNLLEPVVADGPSETAAFLAFPMGALNCDLNISVLTHSDIEGTLFTPSARPVRTYDTPIQQITSSKSQNDMPQNTCVAVRTFGLTSLLRLVAPGSTNQYPQTIEIATVQHADIGNRAIVDFKLSPSPTEGLVVNERGQLYKFMLENGLKTPYLVHTATVDNRDSFWRVAASGKDTCLFMSKKTLKVLDFRTDDHLSLFSILKPRDVLTAVEDDDGSNVIRLCSTREILWIDKRFPKKPLLGYRHGRNWDRSLSTQTLHTPHGLTLLTSRSNGLVTVYDISRPTESLLGLNAPPYYLWPKDEANKAHCGQAFFQHPLASPNKGLNMYRLSDRGSVLQFGLDSQSPSDNRFSVVFSEDMKKLEQQASLRPDDVPFGNRDFSESDLALSYKYMFCTSIEERRKAEEESADAFHQLLDEIAISWRDPGSPTKQMLTTYDALFRTSAEPVKSSRADFLTEGPINSTQGYRALMQEQLSARHFINDAAWHISIAPILKRIDPRFCASVQEWSDNLHQHDLRESLERPNPSTRRETEAREQLTLDLSLSMDVFSAQLFPEATDENVELEEMTKTLSIVGEPPKVDFGYFRPLPKNSANHSTKAEDEEVNVSIGARMLIKEWQLGEDPDMYDFRDYYDGTMNPQNIQRTSTVKPPTKSPETLPNAQSQRPPLLVTATTFPAHKLENNSRNSLAAQSSIILPQSRSQIVAPVMQPASQEYMASTQVLPGPYGGRPLVSKKKPTKKRLGGF